jgi:hypothetical protein
MIAGVVIALIGPKEIISMGFFRAIYVGAFTLFTSMLIEAISTLPAALRVRGISQ